MRATYPNCNAGIMAGNMRTLRRYDGAEVSSPERGNCREHAVGASKKILPSMRAMQFAGAPIIKTTAASTIARTCR